MTGWPAAGSRPRHVVVEGTIGVGKTSLARRLAAHLGARLLLEPAHDNPFLGRFYADMAGYALRAQLCFSLQRARARRTLAQVPADAAGLASDIMFGKDALFAQLRLQGEDYGLYAQLRAGLLAQAPPPDLVIRLQAPAPVLTRRIRTRPGDGAVHHGALPAPSVRRVRAALRARRGRTGAGGGHRAVQTCGPRGGLR